MGAVVVIVEFSANILGWFWADDLPLDGVGEEAVEAVLAISHVEVNAGVVAAIDMDLTTFWALLTIGGLTLADCKVLICTKILDLFQLSF